jgi:hypothetical protein
MKTPNCAQQLAAAQAVYFALQDKSRKKPRRKLGPYEHKGVAYYDRERMRKPLPPIVHPREFDGYRAPPTWTKIPASWGAWETVPAGYFHQSGASARQSIDDLDDPPIAQTADYILERCHVDTVCERRKWQGGAWITDRQPVTYRWELTFADGAQFRFVSRAIAESALSELLKIRKAKHRRPKFTKPSPENEAVFFTNRNMQKLAPDALPVSQPSDAVCIDTQAQRGAA